MKFKNVKLVKAAEKIMTYLGIKEIPIADGKINFEEGQQEKLKEELSEEVFSEIVEAFNQDLASEKINGSIKQSLEEILKELEISPEAVEEITVAAKGSGKNETTVLAEAAQKTVKEFKATQAAMITKLSNDPENDLPIEEIPTQMGNKLKHSATHVFGSGKPYDAIEGRGWNAAAIKGMSVSSTDYSDPVVIKKLNGDADLYFRQNPEEIKSLHRDNFSLPTFWPKRLNVDDKVSNGTILTAEITQGRKFQWLPKNIQEIEAEEGKIYPVQIDAEWNGAQLQQIESSWLNMLNKEGSQPEKWSFVRFLVAELMKRARVEDRISTLNGIFVQTPKSAKKPGRFINRQNGLFFQIWKARDITKKYRAFSMGEITPENVYDYFHSNDPNNPGYINRLPQEVLTATNVVTYLHHSVWTWYKAKYKQINGQNMDYKGLPEHFENYPNIRVETFVDQEVQTFVLTTFDDNIEILENIPSEKSSYRFQTLLRQIYLLGDYKLGVRLIHIGREVKEGDPNEFKVQSVWSNDAPIFREDKFIPVYDMGTGKLNFDFKNVQVDEEWGNDVTELTGLKSGQVVKIRGNSAMITSKKVKNNAKIALTGGDFDLKSDKILILYIKADLTAKELRRIDSPSGSATSEIEFSEDTINADAGLVFKFNGSTSTTLTGIDGGVEGKIIRIYGTDVADVALTIATIENLINVGSTAKVLATANDYVELVFMDKTWYLTDSVIS